MQGDVSPQFRRIRDKTSKVNTSHQIERMNSFHSISMLAMSIIVSGVQLKNGIPTVNSNDSACEEENEVNVSMTEGEGKGPSITIPSAC